MEREYLLRNKVIIMNSKNQNTNAITIRKVCIIFLILFLVSLVLSLFIYWLIIKDYYIAYQNIEDCSYTLGFNPTSVIMCIHISLIISILLLNVFLLIEKKKLIEIVESLKIRKILNFGALYSCFAIVDVAYAFSTIYNRFVQNIENEWIYQGRQVCLYSRTTDMKTISCALGILLPFMITIVVLNYYIQKDSSISSVDN